MTIWVLKNPKPQQVNIILRIKEVVNLEYKIMMKKKV